MDIRVTRGGLLLALSLFAAACSGSASQNAGMVGDGLASSPGASATPRPSAGPNDQSVYAQIESQVEQLRGLSASSPVTPVLLSPSALAQKLTEINSSETNHTAMAAQGRLLIHLGMLPAGSDLEKMEADLDSGQVIGFYDPQSKGLYVLSQSGGVGPMEKVTFSHEFTHALQDQNFGLDGLAVDAPDQSDRDDARVALVEGDATLSMTQWSEKYLTLPELLSITGQSMSGSQQQQLDAAPPILRESLMFPYEEGLSFVQALYAQAGWSSVDAVYSNPPDSTSQILHPELYTGHVEPVSQSVPAVPASLSGWKLTMQDTMGELELRIWLEGKAKAGSQSAAAAGWAGDRVGLYEGPNGAWVVVVQTAWRTAKDESEFQTAAGPILSSLASPSSECGDSTHEQIVIASDQTLIPAFAACKNGA